MPLPIDSLLPDVVRELRRSPALLVRAPTGAGKTTRLPPALLEFGRVFVVEPRRLAARAAARRMAEERGERLRETIGYHVRFDRQIGPQTRLTVATPGILLRHFHDDPALERADVLVFDEFHERGLENDLALGMARLVQQTVRPELKIVVMSATLDTGGLAEYLGRAPVLTSEGRLFPIDIRYEDPPMRERIAESVADAIVRAADERDGDVLAFLPGVGEIRQTSSRLQNWARESDIAIAPLYGDLPGAEQDLALRRQPRRKVVLATNVAETSVTVDGVSIVVDSGQARVMAYDPAVGMDRLSLEAISRASADQRAGRAGRTGPGLCVRLWSEAGHRMRADQTDPEIRRVDLAGPVLHLLALGERDIAGFPWLEPPRTVHVEHAQLLLERLGATASGTITELGQTMARLPVHPRLARLLIEGARRGIIDEAALAAALLSERDPFFREAMKRGTTHSDLMDRVHALAEIESVVFRSAKEHPSERTERDINLPAARHLLQVRDQLVRGVREETAPLSPRGEGLGVRGPASHLGRQSAERILASLPEGKGALVAEPIDVALLAAFPDRLARRRESEPRRGVMVGGRGVKLLASSGVVEGELFLCLDIDAGEQEALVRMASAIPRSVLPAERLQTVTDVVFDEASVRVVARKRLLWDDLMIEETPAHLPAGERVAAVLAEAAIRRLERVQPDDPFLNRLRWLRAAMPDADLPEVDLAEVVADLCAGRKSFAELRTAHWGAAIAARLTHRQRQFLEREAPERWTVPSGSAIALTYEAGKPPVLAVRIQEMFGLADSPRVAGGRVKVLLHLLAPNGRPQQVTDDLASFWANTYQVVRKELRVRYPKHAWPEDPWTEPPRRGRKPR